MKPTPHLRFVRRAVPHYPGADIGTYKNILQQWHEAEGWEHEDYVKAGGEWQDVELTEATPGAPIGIQDWGHTR